MDTGRSGLFALCLTQYYKKERMARKAILKILRKKAVKNRLAFSKKEDYTVCKAV